ncbi:hypothetical protein CR513_05940, partial [Mucuna pruriens]
MKRMFLKKFFLVSKIASIKKEICDLRQHSDETLYEYLERFNKLMLMDRRMIDVVCGRALMDKTPTTARNLISNMVGNTQQFGVRGSSTSRVVNETKPFPLPFLTRTVQARKFELDEELMQIFKKVEINIPLLDAVKRIPK